MEIFVTLGHGQPNFPGYIKVIGPNWETCRGAVHALTKGHFFTDYPSLESLHPEDRIHRLTIEASLNETKPYVSSVYDINCALGLFEGWEPEMVTLIGKEND